MPAYYLLRRVPEAFSSGYFWRQVAPLSGPFLRSALWSVWAEIAPTRNQTRASLRETARAQGDQAIEEAQRHFFDRPGLDTLFVRELTKVGRDIARVGRIYLWLRVGTGRDKDGRARHNLQRLPQRGYDQLMLVGLAVGTALGYFTGGKVHNLLWWDSAAEDATGDGDLGVIPPGHPLPALRRFNAPTSLGDLGADIDDLYWADAYGQSLKVTRVGEGSERRWLVSLPGTDHGEFASKPNVADNESNLREELNIPSAMRIGTIRAINDAMRADGIPAEERVNERVLICGHSQGGMIAVALAAQEPEELGFNVDAVITLGSPARRLRLRPEVAMLAVEHDQDIVPSLDGTPRREPDQRVVMQRKLVRPRRGPLFYAHASSTYTETLRYAERQAVVAPWGKMGETIRRLRSYLPKSGEPTRVTHHYTWQEILDPSRDSTWNQYVNLETPHWQAVTYGGEVELGHPVGATPLDLMGKAADRLRGEKGKSEADHD